MFDVNMRLFGVGETKTSTQPTVLHRWRELLHCVKKTKCILRNSKKKTLHPMFELYVGTATVEMYIGPIRSLFVINVS